MVVEEVVVAVSVDVCAVVLLMVTEVGDRLHVAGLVAPEGEVVTEQVSATVPVNEFDGVTVMVEVLPVVAPGAIVMLPLFESVKLLLPLGACQKSLHPAIKTAATKTAMTKTGVTETALNGAANKRSFARRAIAIAAPFSTPAHFLHT